LLTIALRRTIHAYGRSVSGRRESQRSCRRNENLRRAAAGRQNRRLPPGLVDTAV